MPTIDRNPHLASDSSREPLAPDLQNFRLKVFYSEVLLYDCNYKLELMFRESHIILAPKKLQAHDPEIGQGEQFILRAILSGP